MAAEQRLSETAKELPRAIDIANGEAELTDEQRAAWDATWAEMQQIAADIRIDPWWAEVDQAQARLELLRAARERATQLLSQRELK
ncbi:hypothetical protein EBO15_36650 [Actinomadura harenae]|uniref:Uncharacterized protein n=1 Tax=Actinomadura harenae TaxID=2483351 RepID=A0A3M2LKV1_9ACTN|nr:hypothetical protein EBO15_36650 [Actinomadura harenae]